MDLGPNDTLLGKGTKIGTLVTRQEQKSKKQDLGTKIKEQGTYNSSVGTTVNNRMNCLETQYQKQE